MIKFSVDYFLIAVLLFIVEVLIALFVHDRFVRPFVGDFLAVIFIYAFLKSFLNVAPLRLAAGVLIFSFFVETLQYFQVVQVLGLERHKIARIVIGTSFSWLDLVAYTLGILFVILFVKKAKT